MWLRDFPVDFPLYRDTVALGENCEWQLETWDDVVSLFRNVRTSLNQLKSNWCYLMNIFKFSHEIFIETPKCSLKREKTLTCFCLLNEKIKPLGMTLIIDFTGRKVTTFSSTPSVPSGWNFCSVEILKRGSDRLLESVWRK